MNREELATFGQDFDLKGNKSLNIFTDIELAGSRTRGDPSLKVKSQTDETIEIIEKLKWDEFNKPLLFLSNIERPKIRNQYSGEPISILYYMQFKKPPVCIAKLNIWERILIQKARCFQTIGKLNPVSKWKGQNVISTLKGLAIHLPLALHETYSYVQTTLPSSDNLSIFVHSSSGWIVVVLAPTGIAAYNINGQTLHRFLSSRFHTVKSKDIETCLIPI